MKPIASYWKIAPSVLALSLVVGILLFCRGVSTDRDRVPTRTPEADACIEGSGTCTLPWLARMEERMSAGCERNRARLAKLIR